jgi:hypothetical protein
MLADTPSPRGPGATRASMGTLSEGFERSVASPLQPRRLPAMGCSIPPLSNSHVQQLFRSQFYDLLTEAHYPKPTNRSQAPHVQASARIQRTTQDKQWDGGPYRFRPPVPAHVSRDREGTCGHAIRRS